MYVKKLSFKNFLSGSILHDNIKFMQLTFGLKLNPSKSEMVEAQMKWGMMMQSVARSFNTYFSQAVQAWQLLRIAVVAGERLDALKRDSKIAFDKDLYDEKFLEGRILVARHFVSSPACLDKSIFCWQEFFYNNAATQLEYEHLADKPSRITMA
jgi:hypothetical protein